jgi:hypothetical protein
MENLNDERRALGEVALSAFAEATGTHDLEIVLFDLLVCLRFAAVEKRLNYGAVDERAAGLAALAEIAPGGWASELLVHG